MDRQLRELERRAGGSEEDQARLLLARVRVGRLDERRLRLAAYVGDAPARLALRWSAPDLAPLRTWLVDLRPWGPEAAARAALAAARTATAWRGAPGLDLDPPVFEPALTCAEAWLLQAAHPDDLALDLARAAEAAALRLGEPSAAEASARARCAAEALVLAVRAVHALIRPDSWPADVSLRARDLTLVAVAAERAAAVAGEEAVRSSVRDELRGWALGDRDPVRARAA